MQRIEADLMLPGRGDPVADAVVLLDGPTISYAGPAAEAPEAPGAETVRTAVVMPGLWDCHVHLLGQLVPDLQMLPREPIALRAARGVAALRTALDVGVTSVREVAGLGLDLARAVEEGTIPVRRVA